MKNIIKYFLVVVFCLGLFNVAKALEINFPNNDESNNILISSNIDDNLLTAGEQVNIESKISGDGMIFGNNILLKGEIANNLFSGGSNITIIEKISRDAFIAGNNIVIEKDSTIEKNLYAAGKTLNINGNINGNANLAGNDIIISGNINGNLKVYSNNVTLKENATVKGIITYYSNKDITINKGAVYGSIEKKSPINVKEVSYSNYYLMQLLSLIVALIVGIILINLFSKSIDKVNDKIKSSFFASFWTGVLALFLSPFITVFLFTVGIFIPIGIPLMLIYIGLLIILIYISKLYISVYIGKLLTKNTKSTLYSMTIGLIVFYLIMQLPVFGSIFYFISMLVGLGACVLNIFPTKKVSANISKAPIDNNKEKNGK